MGEILDRLALVIFVGVLLLIVFKLPAMWRGKFSLELDPPGWWPLGDGVWYGLMRTAPLLPAWGLPGLLLLELGDDGDVARVHLGGWVLVVWGIAGRVVLYNRPSWVVPPSMRDEPGALEYRSG